MVARTGGTAAVGWREIVLALVFLAMASWELFEIWMLEVPLRAGVSRTLLLHALQVGLILAASYGLLRAWQEKTANQRALARMAERVVFAQEDERRRIAFELHDGVAQLIVSAKHHLDTCGDLWEADPGRAARELESGLDRLRRAIAETRRVLAGLRPSALDSVGLVAALRSQLDEAARQAGWIASFTENVGAARLPAAIETAVLRIAQEALANASRHAATRRVDVHLRREGTCLTLDVRDYGVGLTATAGRGDHGGVGLLSMRERAELLGGTFAIESRPREGTRVRVRLPVGGERADGRAA
jgi:signal transduction histidine kinase